MRCKDAIIPLLMLLAMPLLLQQCKNGESKPPEKQFVYKAFKDSLQREKYDGAGDSDNVFDTREFTPGVDSVDMLLVKIDTLWHRDYAMMQQIDTFIKSMKGGDSISAADKAAIIANLAVLDSFLQKKDTLPQSPCREKECLLYAVVSKSAQTLYLYVGGELSDSFRVSTGMKNHETPVMSVRPSGPLFTKYKSKKFPGGNYKGLGNMPYAVFIRGGYAIHGTTQGNFTKLGKKASHGCIRLHPDNARIFYELVKKIGLAHTWVAVKDSLP